MKFSKKKLLILIIILSFLLAVFLIFKHKKQLYFYLVDKITQVVDFQFKLIDNQEIFFNKKKIYFKRFSNDKLRYRFYLSQDTDNIYLISKEGAIFLVKKKEILNKNNIKLKRLDTNLKKIIGEKYISKYRSIIKGITLLNKKVYVSYLSNKNGCFTNAIASGTFVNEYINFTPLIELDECKQIFNYSVGGIIKPYKKDNLILSTGDFQIPEQMSTEIDNEKINVLKSDPQNKDSFFGKILSINVNTKKISIVSLGHRNPQGLFYDSKNDIIFSTDHGPKGGDEINIDLEPNKPVKNFGWPKSSYGVRYEEDLNYIDELCKNLFQIEYGLLCKSHKKYGFHEPAKYFSPSIGITQILKLDHKESDDNYNLLVASMGHDKDEGDMTIYKILLNKFNNILVEEKYYIGERIRDMINLNNEFILISLESAPAPSIGLIKLD